MSKKEATVGIRSMWRTAALNCIVLQLLLAATASVSVSEATSFAVGSITYEPGYVYRYAYVSRLRVDGPLRSHTPVNGTAANADNDGPNTIVATLEIVRVDGDQASRYSAQTRDSITHCSFVVRLESNASRVVDTSFASADSDTADGHQETTHETAGSVLLKKSIAELFNVNLQQDAIANTTEENFLGRCHVASAVTTSGSEPNDHGDGGNDLVLVRKMKTRCEQPRLKSEFKRRDSILNAAVNRSIVTHYALTGALRLLNATCIDRVRIFSELKPTSFQMLTASQTLTLVDISPSSQTDTTKQQCRHADTAQRVHAQTQINILVEQQEHNTAQRLTSAVVAERQSLFVKRAKKLAAKKSKSGTKATCRGFLRLVRTLRQLSDHRSSSSSSYAAETEVWLTTLLRDSLDDEKLMRLLTDVIVSAGNDAALRALARALKLDDDHHHDHGYLIDDNSRQQAARVDNWLLAAALSSRGNQALRNQVHRVFRAGVARPHHEQSALALGSLAYLAHDDQHQRQQHSQQDERYAQSLIDALRNSSATVTDTSVKSSKHTVAYLAALHNYKSAASFRALLASIDSDLASCGGRRKEYGSSSSSSSTCLLAMKAMRSFGNDMFVATEQSAQPLLEQLVRILNNRAHASPLLRAEALQLVLDKYMHKVLESPVLLVESILRQAMPIDSGAVLPRRNSTVDEFAYLCQRVILQNMRHNSHFREKVTQAFASESLHLSYFDFITHSGTSNALSGSLSDYPSGSLRYSLAQLMTNSGYVNAVDLSLSLHDHANNPLIDFLRLELYADNLDTLVSGGSKEAGSGKTPDASVTLHLSLMGQKIRIVELFRGYSAMISFLWALPTRMTPLFRANFLLSDQAEHVVLSTGHLVKLETLGATSLDLSALSEVSFWNMYAKTNVRFSVGFSIEQKLSVISGDARIASTHELDVNSQFAVDLSLHSDFGKAPVKVCLKMSHRKFYLNEASRNVVYEARAQGADELPKSVTTSYASRLPIQAATYMLSRKAISLC